MTSLFEPGGKLWGAASQSLAMTEAQRLRRRLNAEKAKVLTGDNVEVNLDSATLTDAKGSTYLLPVAFVEKLRTGRVEKVPDARPQQLLEPIDGPLEEKALSYDHSTQPIYWMHVDEMKEVWPVYGYAADYGYERCSETYLSEQG